MSEPIDVEAMEAKLAELQASYDQAVALGAALKVEKSEIEAALSQAKQDIHSLRRVLHMIRQRVGFAAELEGDIVAIVEGIDRRRRRETH